MQVRHICVRLIVIQSRQEEEMGAVNHGCSRQSLGVMPKSILLLQRFFRVVPLRSSRQRLQESLLEYGLVRNVAKEEESSRNDRDPHLQMRDKPMLTPRRTHVLSTRDGDRNQLKMLKC